MSGSRRKQLQKFLRDLQPLLRSSLGLGQLKAKFTAARTAPAPVFRLARSARRQRS